MTQVITQPTEDTVIDLNPGDYFLHIEDKEVYVLVEIKAGVVDQSKFILLCLNDGNTWTAPQEDIQRAFGSTGVKSFRPLRSVTINYD